MKKGRIRSIRFSEELEENINRQVGDTFTARLEGLVTRCMWELPAKEQQLAELEQKIQGKRQELMELNGQVQRLGYALQRAEFLTADLSAEIVGVMMKKGV